MSTELSSAPLSEFVNKSIDLFISCASYENRCLSVCQEFDKDCCQKAVIFYFEEFADSSLSNRRKLAKFFGGRETFVKLFNNNPIRLADYINEAIAPNFAKHKTVVVDITTFTHESLLILLKSLYELQSDVQDVLLVYNGAEYYMEAGEIDATLSYNPVEVRSVMGFMGQLEPARPLHLIVMLGFEYERAQYLIDAYEADQISLGFGSMEGSVSDDLYKNNVKFKDKLISIYSSNVISQFEHSLVNADLAMARLKEVVDQYPDYNTIIAPLNTKISTLGAGLLALESPKIQLCYTQMEGYNTESYSEASSKFYITRL